MFPYINIFGISIPTYGLFMCIAFMLCGFLIIKKSVKAGEIMENMIILIAVAVGSGLFGGVILYICVTFSFSEILMYIKAGDYSFVQNSGLVFYGGLLLGIVSAFVCAKLLGIKTNTLDKCVVPFIPLGHAIGRIGCLLAGCCHGFKYNGIFAVKSRLISETVTYFPIQFVEAMCNIVIMIVLVMLTKKEHYKYKILTSYLVMYSVMRFCLEFFRGDKIRGAYENLSTSQWISLAILIICFVYKIIMSNKKELNN